MDEAGDPTPKYMLIRDAIKDYLPLPNISVPVRGPKMTLPPVQLISKLTLLSPNARRKLGSTPIKSVFPLTFEKIDQYSGFVLYEATLPALKFDPTIFAIPKLNDRALVLIDDVSISQGNHSSKIIMLCKSIELKINVFCSFFLKMVVGILSRENLVNAVALNAGHSGKTVQVLVESQGRINYNVMNDFKGIIGDVLVNNVPLENWTITGFPLDDVSQIEDLIAETFENDIHERSSRLIDFSSDILTGGPKIFHATFDIDTQEIYDTYINPKGWGKVCCLSNSFHLEMKINGFFFLIAGNYIHQRI